MSICNNCSFLSIHEGFRQCLKSTEPKNGDCIDYLDKLPSPLDVQVAGDHYKNLNVQPIEYITANNIGFCEGNIIKYVTRHKYKNGKADLEKAKHYIDLLIHLEYSND